MNPESTYAFYGSLRRGMSNHQEFEQGLEFLYEQTLHGFRLYAMAEYPYAVRTDDPADELKVEIFRATDPRVEQAIHDLELGVGYFYDEVMVGEKRIGIYLYEKAGPETLVKGGDWVKFFRA